MSNSDNSLFTQHEHALASNDTCPECGEKLTVKNGKSGAFLGCTQYPSCQYTRPLVEHKAIEDKILEGTSCPKCQSLLAVKSGRYGMFIGCSSYPDCQHIEDTHEHEKLEVSCPQCKKGTLEERTNRYGKIFYSCDQYPSCKYVLNHQPINKACPECDWPVMMERKMTSGLTHVCPQKKCGCKVKL